MSTNELQRFPIKSMGERASLAAPSELKVVAGPQGPRGEKGEKGADGETRVIYVEKNSPSVSQKYSKATILSTYSESLSKETVLQQAQQFRTLKVADQQMVAYDYYITDELPTDNSIWKVECWSPYDAIGIRHVQVYERVCPTTCPTSCPEDCLANQPGLLVSTENPTTFGASLTKIVGAIPISTYHTGDALVTAASVYRNSFVNLEPATVTPTTADATSLSLALKSAQVDGSIVSGLTTAQVKDQALALDTLVQTLPSNSVLPSDYYVLVYCAGDRCSDATVIDVFSWYLAKLVSVAYSVVTADNGAILTAATNGPSTAGTSNLAVDLSLATVRAQFFSGRVITVGGLTVTVLSTSGNTVVLTAPLSANVATGAVIGGDAVAPRPYTVFSYTVQALSPACEYPIDTVWATMRERGTCVSLPTAGPDALVSQMGGGSLQVDKVPVYMAVPAYKFRIGEELYRNNYSVSVPTSRTTNQTDKTGAVPQGTASHLVGLQYCVKGDGECCPTIFSIMAGQVCSCRLDSRIWGFRLMFVDDESTRARRIDRWATLLPFSSSAPESYGNQPGAAPLHSWLLTTESATMNPYTLSDSSLQIPIERNEREGTSNSAEDSASIGFRKVCARKFRIDFILNPDPEGVQGVSYNGSGGAGAPPISETTAAADGFASAPYTNGSGYKYHRLSTPCSKKFSVTDIKLFGALQECPDDERVMRQLRVHSRFDIEDIPIDDREISIELTKANVTTIMHARQSEGQDSREIHVVINSSRQFLDTPYSTQVEVSQGLYEKVGSQDNVDYVVAAAAAANLTRAGTKGITISSTSPDILDEQGKVLYRYNGGALTADEVYGIYAVEQAFGSLKFDYSLRPDAPLRGLGAIQLSNFPVIGDDAEFF